MANATLVKASGNIYLVGKIFDENLSIFLLIKNLHHLVQNTLIEQSSIYKSTQCINKQITIYRMSVYYIQARYLFTANIVML